MTESFVAYYRNSTPSSWGVEHIDADTPEELLGKAQAFTGEYGPITLIQLNYLGTLHQVWNGERFARIGDGWLYERPAYSDAFPPGELG